MTRSTRIGISIGRCVHSNTRIGSYRCVPVSFVLYFVMVFVLGSAMTMTSAAHVRNEALMYMIQLTSC